MSSGYDKYYTTSDFARLYHVTKDTLFHYDMAGVLKPEFINEKGYRYYSLDQFFTFDIITILKKAEMSLGEIKEYMEHKDRMRFLDLLEKKEKHLWNEQIKLERMRRFLNNTAATIRYGMKTIYGIPRIEEQEEFLAAVKFNRQEGIKNACYKFWNCMTCAIAN